MHRGSEWKADWWLGKHVRFTTGLIGQAVECNDDGVIFFRMTNGLRSQMSLGELNSRLTKGSVNLA